jgi:CRP/FNR family transcriptional regulator
LIGQKELSAANIQTIHLSYAAGETIYERGALAQFVYAVEEGALFRFRLLPGHRRSIQQFLFASDGFGYEIGRHHRDTVQALTDTKVLAAGSEALQRAAASNALLSNLLFAAATSAVLVAEENAVLRVGTVTEKIAQFLLEMEVRLSSKRGEIDLPMRRHHIADYFGLTEETVSRTFSALHNKQIIQFRDQRQRRIVICDKPRLQELASDASIFENSSVLKSRKAMNTPHRQWAMPA